MHATFSPIAWTGGCRPLLPSCQTMPQVAYRRALFRKQVNTFVGYWGDKPERDTLRTFFRRANYDAHATFRSATNN